MTMWLPVPEDAGDPVVRVEKNEGYNERDTIPDYRRRYRRAATDAKKRKIIRYCDRLLADCEPGSSLLVFGAGHHINCNTIRNRMQFDRIKAIDLVATAQKGLLPSIEFAVQDVLVDELEVFDYIFSSHTIEHFTRDELLDTLIPRCIAHARKAVITVCPYKDAWGAAPEHKVRLTERDEVAAMATRYQILSGRELALWFEGEA